MLLENRVALVTGGGAGLGKAIVKAFLDEGACVVATDIREERLETLRNELKNERLIIKESNVADRRGNEMLLKTIVSQLGHLDILVNNAGISEGMIPVGEVEDELWDNMLAINLTGPFVLCRGAVKIMLQQETRGCIINIASAAGIGAGRGGAAYATSKFGLVGLTKNIAYMYAPQGIRCNAICPGYVPTEILRESYKASEYGMERVSAGTKGIREGKPEEIADLAVYLASNKASLINGVAILADAGKGAY